MAPKLFAPSLTSPLSQSLCSPAAVLQPSDPATPMPGLTLQRDTRRVQLIEIRSVSQLNCQAK